MLDLDTNATDTSSDSLNKLAIYGGSQAIGDAISRYNSIGEEEIKAATEVLKQGSLSGFLASSGKGFEGGEKVLQFEESIKNFYGCRHAVSVNSLTSGLICAVGAIGLEPGDEVIVSTWTMCASATAILVWNGIPVFADVDKSTFNMTVETIKDCLTENTKAIIVPSIFGRPAEMEAITEFASRHNIKVIEDAAQSPATQHKGKWIGTWGDIGGFSFNTHKHIQCGEGGVCITDNDALALKMRLIRNHGEAVVENSPSLLPNIIGFNFRLGEIEAAIANTQMNKLSGAVNTRYHQGMQLNNGLRGLKGLELPEANNRLDHAFYMYGMRLTKHNNKRKQIVAALKAEGIPGVRDQYVTVHRYPMYQNKIAYGTAGFPWKSDSHSSDIRYDDSLFPNAVALNDYEYIGLSLCEYELSDKDIQNIIYAFKKVWHGLKLND